MSDAMTTAGNASLLKQVCQLAAEELGTSPDSVNGSTRFFEDLGADSLDLIKVVLRIEETYGVYVSDQDAETLRTPSDIEAWLTKRGKD